MRGKQRHLQEKYYSLIEIETKATKKKFVLRLFSKTNNKDLKRILVLWLFFETA